MMAKMLKHTPTGDMYVYTGTLALRSDMEEIDVETEEPKPKAKAKPRKQKALKSPAQPAPNARLLEAAEEAAAAPVKAIEIEDVPDVKTPVESAETKKLDELFDGE